MKREATWVLTVSAFLTSMGALALVSGHHLAGVIILVAFALPLAGKGARQLKRAGGRRATQERVTQDTAPSGETVDGPAKGLMTRTGLSFRMPGDDQCSPVYRSRRLGRPRPPNLAAAASHRGGGPQP